MSKKYKCIEYGSLMVARWEWERELDPLGELIVSGLELKLREPPKPIKAKLRW